MTAGLTWPARRRRRWLAAAVAAVGVLAAAGVAVVLGFGGLDVLAVALRGDQHVLRDEPQAPVPRGAPTVLLLALDGVGRSILYDMLEREHLPELRRLLGGGPPNELAHAHLDDTMLSVLPSSTLAAWSTIFTGTVPSRHGVTGNEYFVRERRRLAAPAPVSVISTAPVLQTYSEGYVNELLAVPTIYERLRQRDPGFSAWVSMSQIYRGADRLLLADVTVAPDAFAALLAGGADDDANLEIFSQLDREAIESVVEELAETPAPRLLTVYLTGTDLYAHGAEGGPEPALRRYLSQVVDPLIGRLARSLGEHHALEDRYVVVVSDHGHTEVMHDEAHALSTDDGADDPPAVVRGAGFRLRPFELEVDEDDDFDAVITYGGAIAYVYVADRSTCPDEGTACDWARPPRFDEDVVPMAEAFFRASRDGTHAPGMRATLDLVLTRRPSPPGGNAAELQVYVGDGRLEPLGAYLIAHPHPAYVAVESRLRDLAVGPRGHHAGDIMLIARNGGEDDPANRYYFAGLYRSWHGSPSRADSEIPLIVAHPHEGSAALGQRVRDLLGEEPRQDDVARLLEALMYPDARRP